MLLLIVGAIFAVTILAVAAFGAGFWIVDLLPPSFSAIERLAFTLLGGLGILSLVLFLIGQLAFTRATILGTVAVFVFFSNRPNREKYKYSYGAKDCGSCESKLTDQKEHERKNAEAAEQSECEPLDGRKRWRQEVYDPEACPKCGHCKNGNRKYSAYNQQQHSSMNPQGLQQVFARIRANHADSDEQEQHARDPQIDDYRPKVAPESSNGWLHCARRIRHKPGFHFDFPTDR